MIDHIQNRNKVLKSVLDDVFGPSEFHNQKFKIESESNKETLDIDSDEIVLDQQDVYEKVFIQETNKEEILCGQPLADEPIIRYSTGILFPEEQTLDTDINDEDIFNTEDLDEIDENYEINQEDLADQLTEEGDADRRIQIDADYDMEIDSSNMRRQSSAAISFCIDPSSTKKIEVVLKGGRYEKLQNIFYESENADQRKRCFWWARKPERYVFLLNLEGPLNQNFKGDLELIDLNSDFLNIKSKVYVKKVSDGSKDYWIVTLSIRNHSLGNPNEYSLFQTHFEIKALDDYENTSFLPYPKNEVSSAYEENQPLITGLEDNNMIAQMYSNFKRYALGHGCSAIWDEDRNTKKIKKIDGVFVPVYQLPKVNPDIKKENSEGKIIEMPDMRDLSSEEGWRKGFGHIGEIIKFYEKWIGNLRGNSEASNEEEKIIENCKYALERMKEGSDLLRDNEEVKKVFMFMNEAMLLQQERALSGKRYAEPDIENNQTPHIPRPFTINPNRGKWRAFQICFILANLKSSIDAKDKNRDMVELIWFPTGGGKTEAYLGLAAFTILWNRFQNPQADFGTEVLMRYTLRLLTTQQFQRASTLICALEKLRKQNEEMLGETRISLGLFVGGDASPNTKSAISSAWTNLNSRFLPNKFVVDQCPWCGSEMGRSRRRLPGGNFWQTSLGYIRNGTQENAPIFSCIDQSCDYSSRNEPRGLPLYIDDISIIEQAPTLVIGTIDKFAVIPWKNNIQNLFGLNSSGERFRKPPALIIQDELHLISQALGSIAGLWEGLIDYFSSEEISDDEFSPPKIICSTATIKEYKEQILNLFGREKSSLFPPPGLNIEDSFFGSYEEDLSQSKFYVGIHAPSDGSALTTQKRIFNALAQAPLLIEDEGEVPSQRDPWWTNMVYFNSIRELNSATTILQSDMAQYIRAYKTRLNGPIHVRQNLQETRLTGELPSDKVSSILNKLAIEYPNQDVINICFATNILEVGLDVSRLCLMTIIGQPKTTASYIQASGRVGRSKPGLVFTIFNPYKPRDTSHYENFQSYHSRLYSEVEPTSVTPFTYQVLERCLHAVLSSFLIMKGNNVPRPYNSLTDDIDSFENFFLRRIDNIKSNQAFPDSDMASNFKKVLYKRKKELETWEKALWVRNLPNGEERDAIIAAADDREFHSFGMSWPTMLNMRNVDPECYEDITTIYTYEAGDE